MAKKKKYRVTPEVIIAAQSGDQLAMKKIYKSFKTRFIACNNGITRQEYNIMMEQVFKRIEVVNPYGGFYQYLCAAKNNIIFSRGKRADRDLKYRNVDTFTSMQREDGKYFDPIQQEDDNLAVERLDMLREYVTSSPKALEMIKERDKEIWVMYYSSNGLTLEDVGNKFCLHKERIRQICNTINKKLKKKFGKE